MEESEKTNVAVIGAGLTGLTLAFYLKRAGIPFTVFEKMDRPGGVIQTHHEKGFTYESGPNSGVLSRPEAAELLEDLGDDCTLEVADEAAKARWIWKGGRWHAMPSGLVSGITTPLFSFPDKLRLLAEPFRPRGKNPNETLAELVLRRMGKSFLDYAIDPFILGIYSGNPSKLVTRYAFSKLYDLEQDYGSFIGGAIKKAREPKSEREKKATKSIFSVKGGLSSLIDALVKHVGSENIRLNCEGIVIEKEDDHFTVSGEEEVFTHVVSASGGHSLRDLFPFVDAQELQRIEQMEYSQVVQVALGFNDWNGIPLPAFGGLVPSVENRRILGVLFLSSFFKNKAPENGALLSVFLGGVRKPEMVKMTDEEIQQIVQEELIEMFHLPSFDPTLLKIFRYRYAIPQYGLESETKMKTIEMLEQENPGLILAGNIRDGIGIADRIKQGKRIAGKIIQEENE